MASKLFLERNSFVSYTDEAGSCRNRRIYTVLFRQPNGTVFTLRRNTNEKLHLYHNNLTAENQKFLQKVFEKIFKMLKWLSLR